MREDISFSDPVPILKSSAFPFDTLTQNLECPHIALKIFINKNLISCIAAISLSKKYVLHVHSKKNLREYLLEL